MMKIAWLTLWIATNAASQTPKATPETAPAVPTKIIFIGDSLTEGYQLPEAENFPSLIESKLKAAKKNISIVNAGVSGATSASGISRLRWHLKGTPKPKIMVLALGANDGLRGQDIKNIEKNLAATIQLAQDNKIQVLLAGMQIPPNYGQTYTKGFANIYPKLAKKFQIPLIPFLLADVAAKPELNLPDGIHPNAKGYIIVAETVYQHLLPLVP